MTLGAAWIAIVAAVAIPAVSSAQPAADHATSGEYTVALGVACEHCHTPGDPRDAAKPTYDFARRMAAMVRGLNAGPLAGRRPLTCWSCHRGHPTPARLPRANWEAIAAAYEPVFIAGHDDQRLAMSVYAASLGVGCAHCHVAETWSDRTKPAHQTALTMLPIFDLVPTFFDASVRMPRTQCYMCHQGRTVIERTPPAR